MAKAVPRGRVGTLLLALILAFGVYSAVGFLVVPAVAKSFLRDFLSKNLHRKASIEEVAFNPYTLSFRLRALSIGEKDSAEAFIGLDELHLDLQWGSLFRTALAIRELTLLRPRVTLIRQDGGVFNFSDLIEDKDEGPPKNGPRSMAPRIMIRELRVVDGRLDIWDRPRDQRHELTRIELAIPFLSSLKAEDEPPVPASLSLLLDGAPLDVRAMIRPFSRAREMNLELELRDLSLARYLAYLPISKNLRLPSGYLDARIKVTHSLADDGRTTVVAGGEVSLRSLEAQDETGKPVFTLPSADLSVAVAEPMAGKIHISKVALHSPQIHVQRTPAGKLKLQSFVEGGEKDGQGRQRASESGGMILEVDEVCIARGKAILSDLVPATPFEMTMADLEFTMERFSTSGDKTAVFAISGRTELEEGFKASGEFSLFPLRSQGKIELKGVVLGRYAPYYADLIPFDIRDGRLGLEASYFFSEADTPTAVKATLNAASVAGLGLRKRDEKEDFLKIDDVSVKGMEIDPARGTILVEEVASRGGSLAATRMKNGRLSVEDLIPPPRPVKGAGDPRSAMTDTPPWTFTVNRLLLEDYAIHLLDRRPADPVKIRAERIRLSAQEISTVPNTKTRLSLSLLLNEKGSLTAQGEISMDPLAADLRLDLRRVDLSQLRPYVPEGVRIRLEKGDLSAKGRLTLRRSASEALSARYRGDLTSSDFASQESSSGEDLLKWRSLSLKEVDLTLSPLSLDVGELFVEGFYPRIVIGEDGTLNVQGLVAGDKKGEGPAPSQSPPTPIRIGKVLLKGGQIYFMDRTVRPHVEANMLEIEGTVSELTSDETKLSDVELSGKLEHQSPLEITGKINPLRRELFVDVKIRFKDIDLIRMNPYSQRYVGYKIKKGKLFLDLDYLIVNRKLDSKNRVLLDQLTLGDRVESPDALNLPIKLAVAVLKNREGQIILDLPITGNIDDPQFDLGALVGRALTGLLTKVVTAPFAFLSDLFGGEGEVVSVEFDRGSWKIGKPAEEKLKALAQALHERPDLEVELEGLADLEEDGTELRRAAVLEMLKRQKLAEMEKKNQPLPPIQELQIQPEERERLLRQLYDAEMRREGKKETPGILSRVGSMLPLVGKGEVYPPSSEMEAYLMGRVRVTNEDLRALALRRAMAVKDTILVSGTARPERIFLTEPDISEKGAGDEAGKSAVLVKLK